LLLLRALPGGAQSLQQCAREKTSAPPAAASEALQTHAMNMNNKKILVETMDKADKGGEEKNQTGRGVCHITKPHHIT